MARATSSGRIPRWHWGVLVFAVLAALGTTMTALGAIGFYFTRGPKAGSAVALARLERGAAETPVERPLSPAPIEVALPPSAPAVPLPPSVEPEPEPEPANAAADPMPPSNPVPQPPPPPPPAKPATPPVAEPPLRLEPPPAVLPAAKTPPADQVIYLDSPKSVPKLAEDQVHGLLPREFFRQAFLIAARDEFGLYTRDGLLGESAPPRLPPGRRYAVAPQLKLIQASEIHIETGDGRVREDARLPVVQAPRRFHRHLETSERMSRDAFVAVLKKAGFQPRSRPFRAAGSISAETERLLGEMTIAAQFSAARQLHAEANARGDSPAVLGGLARAYAHLGILTEHLWSTDHKIYKARSLLYAERLRQRLPTDPRGLWHRAYAAALAGYPNEAAADCKTATELASNQPAPSWFGVVEPVVNYNADALEGLKRDPDLAALASLLQYLIVEDPAAASLSHTMARSALEKSPICTRVLCGITRIGPLGRQHLSTEMCVGVTTFGIPMSVARMPHLPGTAAQWIGKGNQKGAEPRLWNALADATANDGGEPTWGNLGHLLQEECFAALAARAYFMASRWSVPTGEFVEQHKRLWEGHRFKDLMRLYAMEKRLGNPEFARLLQTLPVDDLQVHFLGFSWLHVQGVGMSPRYVDVSRRMMMTLDGSVRDFTFVLQQTEGEAQMPLASEAVRTYSTLPAAIESVIKNTPNGVDDARVAMWEKSVGHHPAVQRGLAFHAERKGRRNDAERIWKAYLRRSPDYHAYRSLANIYKASGKPDQWRKTLDDFLNTEEPDLTHAQARVEIARWLMEQERWKEAEPYAAAAAESWAFWAMECAADCYEGLGKWAEAETWTRRITERYRQRFAWFFWCKRTGKGDLKLAQQTLENSLREPLGPEETIYLGAYHMIVGKPDKAREAYAAAYRAHPAESAALFYGLACDDARLAKERDQVWSKIPETTVVGLVVAQFRACLAKGDKGTLDLAAIEKVLAIAPAEDRIVVCYYVGRFLEARGKPKEAVPFYRRCAGPNAGSEFRTLAVLRLRANGAEAKAKP